MRLQSYIIVICLGIMLGYGCETVPNQEATVSTDNYIHILDENRAVQYFDRHLDLDATQQSRIKVLAQQYQSQLNQYPTSEQSQHTIRYAIKLASHVIREVLTMEQAEHFVTTDKMANELFGK